MFEIDRKSGEAKRDAEGRPKVRTSHTLNPVPLHLYAPGHELALRTDLREPGLANLAATVLALLGYEAPEDYEASLLGG
jgi:2,3-bisphosphoglycerate-independent phosphoglycerate mutase